MHIYFCGIGGSGLAPLAHIALDMGFKVSGSDIIENQNIRELRKRGANVHIGQRGIEIELTHRKIPIFWVVHSSAIGGDHPEIKFAKEHNLKLTKRDIFVNFVLKKERLELVCVAGTHGKTTTTAMLIWLFRALKIPLSYVVGTNLNWARNGKFLPGSKYLLIEADEYDKHFLAYKPKASLLTSLDYDHPDTYPTEQSYLESFAEFLGKSELIVAFEEDLKKLDIPVWVPLENHQNQEIIHLRKTFAGKIADYNTFQLLGLHNRQNAALAKALSLNLLKNVLTEPKKDLIEGILSEFPGTGRRMEKLYKNLYTDYAHHPTEIQSTLELAQELSSKTIVVYQPHQNLRQLSIQKNYRDCFQLAQKVYWLPTYLTRENPGDRIVSSKELIQNLENPELAEIAEMNSELVQKLLEHLQKGDLIIGMGAGSIDDWLRKDFLAKAMEARS